MYLLAIVHVRACMRARAYVFLYVCAISGMASQVIAAQPQRAEAIQLSLRGRPPRLVYSLCAMTMYRVKDISYSEYETLYELARLK